MPDSKSKPSAPDKPKLEIKPVKDLEPNESQSEDVRGGLFGAGRGVKIFSDVALKRRVAPLGNALAKLRELRF